MKNTYHCCRFLSPAQLHFRWKALHAGGPLPSLPTPSCGMRVACGSGVRGFVVLGCLWNEVSLFVCQTTSTVTDRLKRCGQSKVTQAAGTSRFAPASNGTILRIISPLLTTDDVGCRTVTSRWNVGSHSGEMGEFFFMLLHTDPHEKHRHADSDGIKTYTMLKKNNPFVAGFRKWCSVALKNLHRRVEKRRWRHLQPSRTQ